VARSLRVAVFAEGSGDSVPSKRESGALARIWGELLPRGLGCSSSVRVFPFSKRDLVALDREKPTPTGSIPLDILIQTRLGADPTLQSVVIAWDLEPPWAPDADRCRWQETLDVYGLLAASKHLRDPLRAHARSRYAALKARPRASERPRPHRLAAGEIAVVCMEPMFEAVLIDEPGVFRALGLPRRPDGWPPAKQWKPSTRHPDQALLKPAIAAAQRSKIRDRIVDKIGGDLKTCKNEWGAHLLDALLAEPATRARLLRRPLALRLTEILP
jgi:hypothetical protein